MFDKEDNIYWEEETIAEDAVRAQCRQKGMSEVEIDDLINSHMDAFDID